MGIAGGLGLGKGIKDLSRGGATKGWEGWGGRGALAAATMGLSEVARLGGLGRKTTKDYQKERRANVVNDGNRGWANFYSQNPLNDRAAREVLPEEIKRAEDGSWVRADGSWDPREYAGVQGNADTFGDSWFGLNEDQRNNAVTRFRDEGLYHNNKGNVLIADDKQERARQIFNEILGR